MPIRPTIILDIDGSELGGAEMVRGALEASRVLKGQKYDLVLATSRPDEISGFVANHFGAQAQSSGGQVEVAPATQQLPERLEKPVEVYRNFPDSAIRVAMNRARDAEHSVVISPASTGLVMTAALFTLGRVKGVDRVPIGTPMPSRNGELFFVDGGSNVDCRPVHLYQFAMLSHIYMENVRNVKRPRIALLSNGSEEYKGNALVKEAAALIRADQTLNFVGYTEGHTMLDGDIDIMVCDGFLGNILLKAAEGIAEFFIDTLKQEIKKDALAALAAKTVQRAAFRRLASRMSYENFGGAPLLGLKDNVVICHGRSTATAICNAIVVGHRLAHADIAGKVAAYIESHNGGTPAAGLPGLAPPE
jgi:glycerol-3-phosphate acyltransferase PlsX